MNSFWEHDQLFFEDLPTVGDLIRSADRGILAQEAAGAGMCDVSDEEVAAARAALDEMASLEENAPSGKWVFLPNDYYSRGDGQGCVVRQIDAALVRRRDFKAMKQLSKRQEFCYSAAECRKALERDVKRFGNAYPDLHSWTLTSWKKVLSYRVWLKGEFSRKERYQTLGCIVHDMMLFGQTYGECRSGQRDFKRGMAEAEALLKGKKKAAPAQQQLLLGDYGLEASTDDYQSEYEERLDDLILTLNHNASVDLHRRVADLVKCEKRAEKHRDRAEPLLVGAWSL